MDLAAIPEIGVESVGEEVTYRLPVRPLGLLRLVGLVPLGFSAVWCGTLLTFLGPQFRQLTNHPQSFDYFIGAFLLCFMAIGCVPAGLGLLILFGRCRVRWRNERLTVTEQLGPLGWPRRLPRQPIRKFLVMGGGTVEGGRPLPGPFATLAALSASFGSGAPRLVVTGYPRPWLEALAQDLSARAGLAQSTVPPPVEIYQGPAAALAAEVAEKPAGSPVVVERREASVLLEVPPAGWWKGSMGLALSAIVWCVFMGAFTAALLFGGKFEPFLLLFFGVFWLVGLGMLAVSIHLGRRRVSFTAGHEELTVVKSGPFGTQRLEFRRAEIASVSAGASNVEVNHRPVLELQVRLVTGKKLGFLMGRDAEELRWLATELRNALGLQAPVPATAPGSMAGPYARAGAGQTGGPLGKFLALVIFAAIVLAMFWRPLTGFFRAAHPHYPTRPLTTNAVVANKPAPGRAISPRLPLTTNTFVANQPVPADSTLVFSSFGATKTFQATNVWAVGQEGHAEWFVPTISGRLAEIELAVAPDGGTLHPGKATIFLTRDRRGFPGHTLESFSVSADAASGLLRLESVRKPELRAGVRYWLGARSSKGGWQWHFNDQSVVHNSAREVRRSQWASAGDDCSVGAFSVRVSTNSAPVDRSAPAEEPAETAEQQ